MNTRKLFTSVYVLGLLLPAACVATRAPAPAAPSEIKVSYPLRDGLDVEVTFENRKTYDAVQLGLFLVTELEGENTHLKVDGAGFFPRYFSMVNVEVEDGLLYVSEAEADQYVRAAYRGYQEVVPRPPFLSLKRAELVTEVLD